MIAQDIKILLLKWSCGDDRHFLRLEGQSSSYYKITRYGLDLFVKIDMTPMRIHSRQQMSSQDVQDWLSDSRVSAWHQGLAQGGGQPYLNLNESDQLSFDLDDLPSLEEVPKLDDEFPCDCYARGGEFRNLIDAHAPWCKIHKAVELGYKLPEVKW